MLRVGIIGLGRIGGVHLDAWASVPEVETIAVCDSSVAALDAARKKGLAAYEDPAEMLASSGVDTVSICAPPDRHLPLAAACFEAGVAVLCEKPLAESAESAMTLVETAERARACYQMATKFRHVADLHEARRQMREGAIGDPLTFHIEFAGPVDMSKRWNSDPSVSGGGVLIDNGSHAVDLARFLFSRIARVMAVSLKPAQRLAVEDSALLLVSTECGVTGKIMLSWSMKPSADNFVVIQGTRGQIEVGWRESWLKVDGHAPVKIGNGYDKNASHHSMMSMFRDYVRGQGQGWITAEECLSSALVTDAAYHSMRTGRWVSVEPMQTPGLRRSADSAIPADLRLVAGGGR